MAERITKDTVAHVAKLARLALTDDELELFTGQLAAVLEHAEDVEALDTSGVPPTAHPLEVSPLRVTLWCDRQHVDTLVRALHKTFVE
jgi:aspartyl/glutamyl-tRNA(Asn/Gln) amidotransferase C subunit